MILECQSLVGAPSHSTSASFGYESYNQDHWYLAIGLTNSISRSNVFQLRPRYACHWSDPGAQILFCGVNIGSPVVLKPSLKQTRNERNYISNRNGQAALSIPHYITRDASFLDKKTAKMTQQQINTGSIDYLAINRARWDERAPHVRTILTTSTPTPLTSTPNASPSTPPHQTTTLPASFPTQPSSPTLSPSTCPASQTSQTRMSSTSNATSEPIPSRSPD
jgi:hypothetical protein